MRRKALESLTKKREDERRAEEWEEERKIIIPLNDDSSTDRNIVDPSGLAVINLTQKNPPKKPT